MTFTREELKRKINTTIKDMASWEFSHGHTDPHFSEVNFLYAKLNALTILTEEYHTLIIMDILDAKLSEQRHRV